jgi:Kef-type K+ transport system membrane component KefB
MLDQLFPFFIVLFAGVFFSGFFKRFHLPWAVALLVGGILIGPHGAGIFEINETIDFIGQLGLIFLMFMAGLESRFSEFSGPKKGLFFLSFVNGFIPFVAGLALGNFLGLSGEASILVGIVFVSSSIAVVIPSLESSRLIQVDIGKSIIVTSVIQDLASLVLLSIFLQKVNPVTSLPLPLFYSLLFFTLIFIRWLIPKVRWVFSITTDDNDKNFFQRELRSVFVILIGTVVIFDLIGLHPIIAGFFSGLVLSESIKHGILLEKIRTISYGIFVPTFFIVVGAQTDIGILKESKDVLFVAGSILGVSVLSKYFSGYWGAKAVGFSKKESRLFGVSSIPQLSTTLAVAFTGFELGIIGREILTSMVILSVVTAFIGPILMSYFSSRI